MRAIKAAGSKIEKSFGRALWNRGLRYRKNYARLVGKPDFVFLSEKVVIFCDSEFWHGFNWEKRKHDFRSNQEFWLPKIERNIERDKEVNLALRRDGWLVIRYWGNEINKDLERCALEVEAAVMKRRSHN